MMQRVAPLARVCYARGASDARVLAVVVSVSTTRFLKSHNEPCTLPLSPQKVAQNAILRFYASKMIQLLSTKVCYTVSLCDNFQRQSCSNIIHLTNGP